MYQKNTPKKTPNDFTYNCQYVIFTSFDSERRVAFNIFFLFNIIIDYLNRFKKKESQIFIVNAFRSVGLSCGEAVCKSAVNPET